MDKKLLSGNEAIAQCAWECGVELGVGYPGTPSTETLENLSALGDVYCEWAPNEKVALEVGAGAAIGGVRSLVTMKHVGVNVAADPLLSVCNTGINAGLVILAADDPSMYSSQNEQDSRNYAAFARIPCFEPANSQEAFDFTRAAFELSEKFDTPCMLRETVRIAHTKTLVKTQGQRKACAPRDFDVDVSKYVMMPAFAKERRLIVDKRENELIDFANSTDLNKIVLNNTKCGFICSGAVYMQVKEAFPDASFLKLGLSWPLPDKKIKEFAEAVDECYVIEEVCDYYTMRIKALGVKLSQPPAHDIPKDGELTPARILSAFGEENTLAFDEIKDLPARPPALCPGCPHRLVFTELRRIKAIVTGDIGCYTLGALSPLNAVHTTVDMGASISMAHGFEIAKVGEKDSRPVVAIIGDSTFAHSGITSLLGTIYNLGSGTVCILDNRTTAMTGTQGNPCNGERLAQKSPNLSISKQDNKELDIELLCKALGAENVEVINSQSLHDVRAGLKAATSAKDELNVLIFKSPCRLIDRSRASAPKIIDCHACGVCVQIGCPALGKDAEGKACIDTLQCIGCGQCEQVCPFSCIQKNEVQK